jgi:hypothetical protein
MRDTDHASNFVDVPSMNGFYTYTTTDNTSSWPRWYPYVMGGAPDAEGETGGTPPAGDEKDDKQGDTGDDKSGGDEKKFTQEEVNALIAKETSKAQRGKLDPKELGFESAKALQEFLDTQKEKAEAQKTEQEKALEEAIAKATKEAETNILSKANARVIKAEFFIQAKDAGVVDPAGAFEVAKSLKDWAVEIDDDGVVTGLDKAFFEGLKKEKGYLFGETNDSVDGAGAGAGGKGSVKDRNAELKQKYPALKL